MSKVTFEFDSIEDEDSIHFALYGYRYQSLIYELDQRLRSTTKHGISVLDPEKEACEIESGVAEKYREIIQELIMSYGVRLD